MALIGGIDTADGQVEDVNVTNKALHVLPVGLDGTAGTTGTLATAEVITEAADDALSTDLDCSALDTVLVRVEETGSANPLDQFDILASTDGTNFETLYSTASDYVTPAGILIGTSGDLSSLAAGASGWYILDCRGINTMRHLLSASGGAAAVTVTYSGK